MMVEQKRDPVSLTANLTAQKYDMEKILPLEAVRQHTKTDDVPSVTDFQLNLYRRAAIEAAETYTGLILIDRKVITEDVKTPMFHKRARRMYQESKPHFTHKLQYMAAEQTLYYYGLRNQPPIQVGVSPNGTEVRLPRDHDSFGLNQCCDPCAGNSAARVMYVAGFHTEEDIPAAIMLGALKYIAHTIENAGDNPMVNSIAGKSQGTGFDMATANNPAVASGAIEIWRSCVPGAI